MDEPRNNGDGTFTRPMTCKFSSVAEDFEEWIDEALTENEDLECYRGYLEQTVLAALKAVAQWHEGPPPVVEVQSEFQEALARHDRAAAMCAWAQ